MTAAQRLRRVKHRMWLMKRRGGGLATSAYDRMNRIDDRLRANSFDLGRYAGRDGQWALDSFLRFTETGHLDREVSRRIFCFWFGEDAMSANRRRCLDALVTKNRDLDVVLVTASNLAGFLAPQAPLHPAFEHLSANHKSDYLRGYFMHHHGGGYSDIKEPHQAWSPAFDLICDEPEAWLVGYQEPSSKDCARIESRLGRDLRRHSGRLVGNGAFICRPGTPLTAEWVAEQERRLDYYGSVLRRHPAADAFGTNAGYPVPWTMLQAQVLQPLQLKYAAHVTAHPSVLPVLHGHR